MKTDFHLARRILDGDEEALRVFYDTYFARVYHFVLIRVGGDHHQAEEIVQDTFVASMRAMHRFVGTSTLYSWLCGIAKHKVMDFRRKETRRARVEIPFSFLESEEDAVRMHPEARASVRGRPTASDELVQEALLALPGHYQAVLTQKYLRSRSTREIAQEAGQSAKAIESLLTRARTAFRKSFEFFLKGDGNGHG